MNEASKTIIININFTSYTGNSLVLLVSIDGKREYKHFELEVSDISLYQYGIYEFRDIACMLSGYLDLKLSSTQISLLTARLFRAAQTFVIGQEIGDSSHD